MSNDSTAYEYNGGYTPYRDVSKMLTKEHRDAGLSLIEEGDHSLSIFDDRKQRYVAVFSQQGVKLDAVHSAADAYLQAQRHLCEVA
jgi:hypothetical protein